MLASGTALMGDSNDIPKTIPWSIDSGENFWIYRYINSVGARMAGGAFLAFWLLCWTMGCLAALRTAIERPDIASFVLICPFFVAWIAATIVLSRMLLSKRQLFLSPQGLGYEVKLFIWHWRRLIPLAEIASIRAEKKQTGKTTHYHLIVETIGEPLRLSGYGDEVQWLARTLQDQLAALRRDLGMTDKVKRTPTNLLPEVLERTDIPASPVSDSKLSIEKRAGELSITIRRSSSMTGASVLLFLNLFWNGIVSLFVIELIQDFRWFLFFFLIPFELLGLLLLWGLFAAVTAPFRSEVWIFRPDEISRRQELFGIGHGSHHQFTSLDHLELHWTKAVNRAKVRTNKVDTGEVYTLRLVDKAADVAPVDIHQLTEGDARHLADVLYRYFHTA